MIEDDYCLQSLHRIRDPGFGQLHWPTQCAQSVDSRQVVFIYTIEVLPHRANTKSVDRPCYAIPQFIEKPGGTST